MPLRNRPPFLLVLAVLGLLLSSASLVILVTTLHEWQAIVIGCACILLFLYACEDFLTWLGGKLLEAEPPKESKPAEN